MGKCADQPVGPDLSVDLCELEIEHKIKIYGIEGFLTESQPFSVSTHILKSICWSFEWGFV